jgi:UDP-N-acetylglucosamine--N-acetylmuramyl-(pentapeptide) pyrophosphoryl-undecaprenol N-acetylglucosamine transferase
LSSLQFKKSKMSENFFIVSGGTGGHIIPARCFAEYLAAEGRKVLFFGDEKVKSYVRSSDAFPTFIIKSSQVTKNLNSLINAAAKIAAGIIESIYFLLKYRPKYVVAFGGYATFPMLIACRLTVTKIILHEQNSHLGKVNRIFAKNAHKIALSFPQTSGIAEEILKKTVFVGNPVRQEIAALHDKKYSLPKNEENEALADNRMGYNVLLASDFKENEVIKTDFFKILILGGSGGAKIFSEILPKSFFNLSERLKEKIQVIQQCRSELVNETFEKYKSFNINIVIDSFFENMPEILSEVHLVIARSGSSSISEFCAAKKPMILVPFAAAADDHQAKNAAYLAQNNAAIVLSEKEFTINAINDLLKDLVEDESRLKKLSDNAGRLAILDATKNLARILND